jgi:hypothetical protein
MLCSGERAGAKAKQKQNGKIQKDGIAKTTA